MDSRDELVEDMKKAGIPVTRQNYIEANWGMPLPSPWDAEYETELPEDLQDWSLFDLINGEFVFKKGAFPNTA